jgi:hypothetical protein
MAPGPAAAITGRCLCGSVCYAAAGEPLFALLCYCTDCQRASGTGHVPILGVARAGFTVTGPAVAFRSVGSSGHMAVRNHCARCRSLMFGMPEAAPDLVTIYAGTLDDPGVCRPTRAQFLRSRQPWDPVPADVLHFNDGAPDHDPQSDPAGVQPRSVLLPGGG